MRRKIMQFGIPLVLIGVAASAEAQQHGNPVYLSPSHGTGLSINADVAKGLNDASGKTLYFGGRAVLGVSRIVISAGAGSISFDDVLAPGAESEIAFGGNVSVNIFDLPAAPVAIGVFAGVGTLSEAGTTLTTIPAGAVISISPPTPGASIEVWAAPGIRHFRVSGFSNTEFAVSGGLNLGLPMGLGFHVAADWVNSSGSSPLIVGGGAHYQFSIPGL